jgi:hypothetical protein
VEMGRAPEIGVSAGAATLSGRRLVAESFA